MSDSEVVECETPGVSLDIRRGAGLSRGDVARGMG